MCIYGSKKMEKDKKDDVWFVRGGKTFLLHLGLQ